MRYMKRRGLRMFAVAALLPALASGALAQAAHGQTAQSQTGRQDSSVIQQVTQTVRDFLAAVPKGEKQTFDTFFADDVIYTRAAGITVTKADIIRNIDARAANDPTATYGADDFTVHLYGNMAVVNFRLIMHGQNGGKEETTYFRNTGTFLKRSGKWQAVAWQATKVPEAAAKP